MRQEVKADSSSTKTEKLVREVEGAERASKEDKEATRSHHGRRGSNKLWIHYSLLNTKINRSVRYSSMHWGSSNSFQISYFNVTLYTLTIKCYGSTDLRSRIILWFTFTDLLS